MLALLFFLLGLYSPSFGVPLVDAPQPLDVAYYLTVKLILVLGAPLVFSFPLIILEEKWIGSRDEDMAEEITTLSEQNEYDVVVVSCGDAHLNRLPELLEDKGWEVQMDGSGYSLISRIYS